MATTPNPLSILLRTKVREVLNLAPGFPKSERMTLQLVNQLMGGGISIQEVRDAMEWNLERRYIRSELDDDKLVLWYITEAGQAQQRI